MVCYIFFFNRISELKKLYSDSWSFVLVSFKIERMNILSLWLDFQACSVLTWILKGVWLMLFILI